MRKNLPLKIVYLTAAVVMVVNLFFTVKNNLFYSLDNLPDGKMLYQSQSPDGKKTITAYSFESALGDAVRVEVSDNTATVKSLSEKSSAESKNIFWQVDAKDVYSTWIANDVILINNIAIDISDGGSYDSRREHSVLQEGNGIDNS